MKNALAGGGFAIDGRWAVRVKNAATMIQTR